jgi:cellulose synthase operon protein C
MKRRLNVRMVTMILTAAILLGLGVHGLHGIQINRKAGALLDRAERAEAQGDLEKAQELLGLFLGFQRKHSGALAKYGLIRALRARSHDDRTQAMRTLEQALHLDPDRPDIRRRVIDLALSLDRYTVAQTHLRVLLRRSQPGAIGASRTSVPDEGELEELMGRCSEGVEDYAKAALWYKDAITHAPDRIAAYVRLSDVSRKRLGDVDGADRTMDARETNDGLVAANTRSPMAYLERARYRKLYKIDGAERDVTRALELAPTDADVLLTASAFAIERGDFPAATRHLTTGLEHNPGNWRLSDSMAWIDRRSGRFKEAEACLRRGIEAPGNRDGHSRLMWVLADVLIDEGKWSDARGLIDRLAKDRVAPELLKYLGARIMIGESNWLAAASELEAIYPLLAGKPALAHQADLLLGQCYEQLGDVDRRYEAFRRAVALLPEEIGGRVGLAATLAAMGRLDDALGVYRTMIGQTPIAGPSLARLLILRNLRRPPDQRDWRDVDEVLTESSRVAPTSTELSILRAEALVAQDQPDRARDLLVKARNQQPDQAELWIALGELADRQASPKTALTLFQEVERRLGDRVEVRLARANHWARSGGVEAVEALAPLERDLAKFAAIDQERLLRGLTEAHLRIGDNAVANRLLRQLVGLRPFDLSLRFSQFDLALQAGDGAAMESILDSILSFQGSREASDQKGDAQWQCARARFLIWSASRRGPGPGRKEDLDNARVLLAKAGSRRPSWPVVPVAEAQIDELLGNQDGAIKSYLKAIELGMDGPEVIRRAVQLLFDRRRYSQADELMRTLQARGLRADDSRLPRLAAEVSLQVNDRARALELARKAAPVDSKNYRDHLWLGQIVWAAGETAKAEPELRRAVELAAGAPDALITFVQYLARTGRKEQARTVIEQARGRLSGDQAFLALAQCYAELGDLDQARAQFRAALAKEPDDAAALRADASFALATGAVDQAQADLKKLIDLQNKAPADAQWARRLLAIVLASSGNRGKSLEALKLLGLVNEGASYLPATTESIDDIRAKVKVLSFRNNRDARRAAIRGLQQIIERELSTTDDQYLLFQLYQADGNRSKAEGQLQSLLAGHGENPPFLAQYILILLRQGSTDEAQSWFDRLEKLEPKSLRTLEMKARLLAARGRAIQAVPLLTSAAGQDAGQVGYAARLLEELGQYAAAEEMMRKYVAQARQPQTSLVLATFLGRRNRLAEALDLCEKAWGSSPPEVVAAAIVSALYAVPVDHSQCQRAGRSVESESTKMPSNAGLLFQLGNIRSLEGRFKEAEALYRESYARDPNNSGPLANLAWLLARRDGNGSEALEVIARAILLDGPTPDLLDTRAIAYLAMGRSDLAIKDLQDAVAVNPSGLKFAHLAQAYLMANRRIDAGAAFESAKAAGLRTENLAPLEKKACRGLLEELAQR